MCLHIMFIITIIIFWVFIIFQTLFYMYNPFFKIILSCSTEFPILQIREQVR